jgi:CMP-N-acetylneuraminic acid synthetase
MNPLIAIIPSRGGSKRIPLKSLEKINEKTMLSRTIDLAKRSNIFTRILVSTDSQEIADEARLAGAEVPNLRSEFFDDISPVSLATIHTFESLLDKNSALSEATIVQLMPNCPFLSLETLLNCVKAQQSLDNESLLSCVKIDAINWYAFTLEDNDPRWIVKDVNLNARTQDNPSIYVPTGSVWIAKAEYLLTHRSFYGPKYHFHEIPYLEGFDIDTVEQLDFARMIAKGQSQI